VCCFLFVLGSFVLAQSKEEKLQQLNNREDVKVTEVKKDILKLEYPGGKVRYKNIGDFKYPESSIQHPEFSLTFESTIIDLTTIDTTLYYQKYKFWQEVPLTNLDFSHLMVGDVNDNRKTELYGLRKYYETPAEPVCIYELDPNNNFQFVHQYDSVLNCWNIYDIDKDGKEDVHLGLGGIYGIIPDQRFFSKITDSSFATKMNVLFSPFTEQTQLNDQTLGDFDNNGNTDLIFARFGTPSVYIYEYDQTTNNFDSVYRFDVFEQPPWGNSGFSIGDFDLDGNKDIVFGTGKGNVFVIENEGNNQYTNSWQGMVETYAAYIHTWSNDIDGNGKPEFWVLGDAFYNGVGITRITIFETTGDNSYQQVGRVDLVGVFSFYAGTLQAVDIDNDGIEEVAICVDGNFLILKFNGSKDHHTYEINYIKQTENVNFGYYGAYVKDLLSDGENELLLSMYDDPPQPSYIRFMTRIFVPDSLTSTYESENYTPSLNKLYPNYPSPFNPTTSIKFNLNSSENMSIKIYNTLGKEIRTLLDNYLPSGEHTVQWDGKDDKGNILPGGVYFIQMIAGGYQKTIKTIFLK
ncbi:MAG: FG-GAP-like repeat-containing protein, partial [Ignavibacterium sp.]|nr:FG-GAP-like repeat-containing protein [Ignavibacterium sp.]